MFRQMTDGIENAESAYDTGSFQPSSLLILDEELQNPYVESEVYALRKDHQCPFCSSAFSKHEHLTRHVRSHTKEKPFECSICEKRFARHDTLLRHMRSHPVSWRNKVARQNSNVTAASGLSHTVKGTSHNSLNVERCGFSEPDIPSSALSATSEVHVATAGDALVLEEEIDSEMTFPHLDITDQSSIPMEALNNTFSKIQGTQGPICTPPPLNNIDSVTTFVEERLLDVQFLSQFFWETIPTHDHASLGHTNNLANISAAEFSLSDMDINSLSQSWFAGDDFDLRALNSTTQSSRSQYADPRESIQEEYHDQFPSIDYDSIDTGLLISGCMPQPTSSGSVSEKWFSNIGVNPVNPGTRTTGPGPGSGEIDMDEAYRIELSSRLHIRSNDEALPSTEFLNLCIRMYFTRFNPIFPLLHSPTFQPSAKNSLLLLSICSVGSIFIGSTDAILQGARIFERLNKVILASWEHNLANGGDEALSMIQAAIVGQAFGLLSGNPWHLAMVDTFHGTVISWARRSKIFQSKQAALPLCELKGQELNQAWRKWAYTEEVVRMILALHIQDSELASIFHHEPVLRHNRGKISLASSSELFVASNADQWITICRKQQYEMSTRNFEPCDVLDYRHSLWTCNVAEVGSFTAYAVLAGIAARICETRNLGDLDQHTKAGFVESLVHWYQQFRSTQTNDKADPLCLIVLWHSTFMTLLADLDMLEQAVGRDSPEMLESSANDLSRWVSSLDAKRCLFHGFRAYKHVMEMQNGMEPAIHVPRTLFLTGIALFCYVTSQVNTADTIDNFLDELLSLPEVKLLDKSTVVSDASIVMNVWEPKRSAWNKLSAIESLALCNVTGLLQRIGHWEIARKYALTLNSVLQRDKGIIQR